MKFLKKYSIYFAWVIALMATVGSLYASEILNIKPCIFCWYQRAFMFPLAIILGVAAYKKNRKIFPYIIALPIIGAMVAFIQTFFSYFNLTALVCGLDCMKESQKLFGFLDMSIASFFAFSTIAAFLIISRKE